QRPLLLSPSIGQSTPADISPARTQLSKTTSYTRVLTSRAQLMAWRAAASGSRPRRQAAEAAAAAVAPRPKLARGEQKKGTGRGAGSGDTSFEAEITMMQMMRQLPGSLWDFSLVPGGHLAVGAAVEAATTYAERRKEKGGKTMGPPHLHVGVDFFVEMGQDDKAEGEHKVILTDFRYFIDVIAFAEHACQFVGGLSLSLIDVIDMQNFGDILSYCNVKKAYAEQGQPERWKLHLMFNSLASSPEAKHREDHINAIREGYPELPIKLQQGTQIADIRRAVVDALRAAGAQQIFGAPPPSGLKRQIQAALRARQQLPEG
ncbi:unnamed protein product, partial [Prorocentrum cordatum]